VYVFRTFRRNGSQLGKERLCNLYFPPVIEKEELIRRDVCRVFVSYSRADRPRVTGLGLLLEALGHKVFLDHKTIKPGVRWDAKLQEGLDQAEVLVVFWTKGAARSEWVRKEYEYFHARSPDRLLVPVLGDETPLAELLKVHQHSDFIPLVNELLAIKRQLTRDGVDAKGIQQVILKRLADAGIDIDENNRKKLFGFVGVDTIGSLGVVTAAFGLLRWAGSTATEAAAQLSGAQVSLVIAGVISGGIICGVADRALRESVEPIPVIDQVPAGAPDLGKVWGSSYGDIHLTRNGDSYVGWYGNTNKTIRGTLSNQSGKWILSGAWGRKNDPGYKGRFRFTFTSPTDFTGNWWHGSNPENTTAWTGWR